MQANWSLILNVLLLAIVVIAIGRLMKARKHSLKDQLHYNYKNIEKKPLTGPAVHDDIIAVRKVDLGSAATDCISLDSKIGDLKPRLMPLNDELDNVNKNSEHDISLRKKTTNAGQKEKTIMMFLSAKNNRHFAGYELLQTVLTAGLRFGEGGLFHRHQFTNGEGPILCSLAAATANGIFDLQNIGAFSVRGLCLYMHSSTSQDIDAERFLIMLETANQLKEGLDAHLLDDAQIPLNENSIARYRNVLNLDELYLSEAVS